MKARALSLKQPWAALLAAGRKTVEVRRWATAYRGPLLIHAARVADPRDEAWALVPPELAELARLARGFLGVGELVGCKRYPDAEAFAADRERHLNDPSWYEPAGLYGLCFAELRVTPFRAAPGWVRLFEVDIDERAAAPFREGEAPAEPSAITQRGDHRPQATTAPARQEPRPPERAPRPPDDLSTPPPGRLARLIRSLGDSGPPGRGAE